MTRTTLVKHGYDIDDSCSGDNNNDQDASCGNVDNSTPNPHSGDDSNCGNTGDISGYDEDEQCALPVVTEPEKPQAADEGCGGNEGQDPDEAGAI